ncbi:5-(carboxyamino)imidazole ribonucleotide mutase [Candidatus Hydrogenedentota bacterium]
MAQIGIVMGSDSDLPVMRETAEVLRDFGLDFEMTISSAHRAPKRTAEFAETARDRGLKVIIAAAGGAAHLAGVVAAHTTLPVIGVPLEASALNGLDALYATVQMPAGIPVATVAIGKAGARNAAILAVQILALSDQALADKLVEYKAELERKVEAKAAKLAEELAKQG